MAYQIRKVNDAMVNALVKALNDTRVGLVSTEVHHDVTARSATGDVRDPTAVALTVDAAVASDLPTLLTLSNQAKSVYGIHIANTHVHLVADATNTVAAADATDLATAQTLLNELKADYNTHRSEAGVHTNDDSGNAVAAADATNQATAETLANEIQTDLNAHMADALAGNGVQLIGP